MKKQYKFTPGWLSGFTQADGSFVVLFTKQQGKMPYRPRPMFVLAQSIRDVDMMKALLAYLGVGYLRTDAKYVYLIVDSRKHLISEILPIFDNYTIKGGKFISYLIFRTVVLAMEKKIHLKAEGLLSIVYFAYFTHTTSLRTIESLNKILSTIENEFGKVEINSMKIDLSIPCKSKDISIDYISGLIDGDGSIGFTFFNSKKVVVPLFSITSGIEDYNVLQTVRDYFNCGKVFKSQTKECVTYYIKGVKTHVLYVHKVLANLHLNTVKSTYVGPIMEACNILYNKGIKSDEDLMKILDLTYNLNQDGKYRKMTKEAYIHKFTQANKDVLHLFYPLLFV